MALLIELVMTHEDDGATLLDNLHSFLKSSVSLPSRLTSHDRETIDDVPYIVHMNEHKKGSVRPYVLAM